MESNNRVATPDLQVPPAENAKYSRRDFLKVSGMGLVAWATSALSRNAGFDLSPNGPLKGVNLVVDHVVHVEPQDLPSNFDSELKKCDVFVPEWESWTRDDYSFFNQVSKGTKSQSDIDNYPINNLYFKTVLKHLRGSNKPVEILDIPQGDPLDNELMGILPFMTADYSQSYETHLNRIAMAIGTFADWNRDREKYIIKNLVTLVTKLHQDQPFRFGRKIDIFMEYGAAHQLYQSLKTQDEISGSSQNYPLPLFRFLPSDEVLRRYWFAKDLDNPRKNVKLPDDHLFANVVIEEMLRNWFYEANVSKFANSSEANSWFRDIIEKFNKNGSNEAQDLWDYQRFNRAAWLNGGQDLPSSEQLPELRKILAQKLREKGVKESYIKTGLDSQANIPDFALNYRTPNHNPGIFLV